jgi:hypothetical protein
MPPLARLLETARGTLRSSLRDLGLAVRKSVEEDEDDAIGPG